MPADCEAEGCACSARKLKGGKASGGREGSRLGAVVTGTLPIKDPALTAAAGAACPKFELEFEACTLCKL